MTDQIERSDAASLEKDRLKLVDLRHKLQLVDAASLEPMPPGYTSQEMVLRIQNINYTREETEREIAVLVARITAAEKRAEGGAS